MWPATSFGSDFPVWFRLVIAKETQHFDTPRSPGWEIGWQISYSGRLVLQSNWRAIISPTQAILTTQKENYTLNSRAISYLAISMCNVTASKSEKWWWQVKQMKIFSAWSYDIFSNIPRTTLHQILVTFTKVTDVIQNILLYSYCLSPVLRGPLKIYDRIDVLPQVTIDLQSLCLKMRPIYGVMDIPKEKPKAKLRSSGTRSFLWCLSQWRSWPLYVDWR